MARGYGYRRFQWRRPVMLLSVMGGLVAVGWWMLGSSGIPLIGKVDNEAAEPALERIVPPENAAQHSIATPASPKPSAANDRTDPQPKVERVQAPASPATQPAAATRPATANDLVQANADVQAGLAAKQHNEPLVARERLNRALHGGLPADQTSAVRQALTDIANQTIFSTTTVGNDPLVESYTVLSGDALGRLARRFKVSEDLLVQVNNLNNKSFIREGMRLKLVHGPFHAAITKSDHWLHMYLRDVYLRSFRVALGADGKTPTGRWKVVNHQANPGWTDPRTGKRWHPDDPANPIGEYWIGLEGIEGAAVGAFGYGIHGTIEPQSIGKDVSLGCVRLLPEDIAFLYKLLVPGESFVTIAD